MNLETLLAHMQEVGSTLNNKGYFNQLKAMGSNALTNASNTFPAMTKKDPTIEDLLNTGLNFAAPLSIKGIWKLAKDPALRQSLKDQGYDLTTPWYHGSPDRVPQGQEKLPMFYTESKPYAEFMAQEKGDGAGLLHKVLIKGSGLFDAMQNYGNYNGDTYAKKIARGERVGPLEYSDLLNRAGFKHKSGPFGFEESIDTIPSMWTPDGEIIQNPADALYSPKVQEQLRKEGYNGVKIWDYFDRGEEPTAVFVDRPSVYELTARKTGSSAQLRKLYKTKPLSKIAKKKGP